MTAITNDSYSCASGGVIAGGRAALPSWLLGMPSQRWGLVGNTLASVDPEDNPAINPSYPADAPWHANTGQPDVVAGWGGAAWDEVNKKLRITGGGHAGYAGNELYDWSAETGAFSLTKPPTGCIGNTGNLNDGLESSGVYFDGQPRSCHTYNNLIVKDGVLWHFGGSMYASGSVYGKPHRFVGSQWVLDADVAAHGELGGVCWDSSRNVFWVLPGVGAYRPYKYDPVAHTQTLHGAYIGTGDFCRCHYHAGHDMLVLFTPGGVGGYDPDVVTGGTDSVALTTSGTAPSFSLGIAGSVYDAANNRYLVWHGGTTIYTLTPPATNPFSNAWVWGTLSLDAGNTVDPGSPASAGTYGRFWHSPSLNCCGVVNSTGQQMHVFRI